MVSSTPVRGHPCVVKALYQISDLSHMADHFELQYRAVAVKQAVLGIKR